MQSARKSEFVGYPLFIYFTSLYGTSGLRKGLVGMLYCIVALTTLIAKLDAT